MRRWTKMFGLKEPDRCRMLLTDDVDDVGVFLRSSTTVDSSMESTRRFPPSDPRDIPLPTRRWCNGDDGKEPTSAPTEEQTQIKRVKNL